MKMMKSPRGSVTNWQEVLKRIELLRKEGATIQWACTRTGIAISTYHEWRKRNLKDAIIRGLDIQ